MSKRPLNLLELSAAEVLKQAILTSGKSQEKISGEVGVSQGQIWQWANARLPVPARRAKDLAKALNLSDPSVISPDFANLSQDAFLLPSNAPELQGETEDDIIFIPLRIGSVVYGGHGGGHDRDQYKTMRSFTKSSLAARGLDWRLCEMVKVQGHSMDGGRIPIRDGEFIVFNRGDTVPKASNPGVYVIRIGDEVDLIKRLIRKHGSDEIIIRSDNPDRDQFPDVIRRLSDPDFQVCGRMVHKSGWYD